MKKTILLLMVIVLAACSTVKQAADTDKQDAITVLPINKGLENITVKGQVTFKAKDQQMTGNYKAEIAGTDSLSLTLFGPMQIAAGKLYARTDYFLFYDVFNNRAYEGTPNSQNMNSAFRLELGFSDMIKLFRGELPYNAELYKYDRKIENGTLFKYKAPGEFADFALISTDGSLLQYQRKLQDGTMVMNVQYSEHEKINEYILPGKISLSFPANDALVTFEADSYKTNEEFIKPFIFLLSSDVKRVKY